jgi:hypothetical protein
VDESEGTFTSAYQFVLRAGDDVDSGLTDSATGNPITLTLSDGGKTVTGLVEVGPDGRTEVVVFTLTIDGATGSVTLDQQRSIKHANTSDPDDALSLATGIIELLRTDTITDGDGDTATATASLDIGSRLTFKDDGPTIAVNDAYALAKNKTATGSWSPNVGADALDAPDPIESFLTSVSVKGIYVDGMIVTDIVSPLVSSSGSSSNDKSFAGSFTFGAANSITINYTLDFSGPVAGSTSYGYVLTVSDAVQRIDIESTEYSGSLKASGPIPTYKVNYTDTTTGEVVTAEVTSDIGKTEKEPLIGASGSDVSKSITYVGTDVNVSTDGIGVSNNILNSYYSAKDGYQAETLRFDPPGNASSITLGFKATGLPGWTAGDVLYLTVNGGTDAQGNPIAFSFVLAAVELTEEQVLAVGQPVIYLPPGAQNFPVSVAWLKANFGGDTAIQKLTAIDSLDVTAGFSVGKNGQVVDTEIKITFGFETSVEVSTDLPITFDLEATITDADGDFRTDAFSVKFGQEVSGTANADVFALSDKKYVEISGFEVNKDTLDLSSILGAGIKDANDLESYVKIVQEGSDAAVWVDTDGSGDSAGWTKVATLEGVDPSVTGNDFFFNPTTKTIDFSESTGDWSVYEELSPPPQS